uniref:Uncharacterized protein n=1 Tax=Timema shepardi TaxID=629360 RepID=A0A7R9B2A4_TIMSH|nr:unnamed protein product [Timema shepardi]
MFWTKKFQYPSLKTITLYRSLSGTNPALNKVLPDSVAWLDNALVVLNSTAEDGEIEVRISVGCRLRSFTDFIHSGDLFADPSHVSTHSSPLRPGGRRDADACAVFPALCIGAPVIRITAISSSSASTDTLPDSGGLELLLLGTVCSHEGRTDMFLSFQQDPSKPSLQHRAVVLNSEAESRLPSNLQNPFYKDPRITAALAKESWFTPGEEQVREREAEKIPRSKIYSIIKNAGFVRR